VLELLNQAVCVFGLHVKRILEIKDRFGDGVLCWLISYLVSDHWEMGSPGLGPWSRRTGGLGFDLDLAWTWLGLGLDLGLAEQDLDLGLVGLQRMVLVGMG